MDQQVQLIMAAIASLKDDNSERMERVESKVDAGFAAMNGRVRALENDVLRVKTLWTAGVALGAFLLHYVVDFLRQ